MDFESVSMINPFGCLSICTRCIRVNVCICARNATNLHWKKMYNEQQQQHQNQSNTHYCINFVLYHWTTESLEYTRSNVSIAQYLYSYCFSFTSTLLAATIEWTRSTKAIKRECERDWNKPNIAAQQTTHKKKTILYKAMRFSAGKLLK